MQVSTCMKNRSTPVAPARDRLLQAAARVYARHGLSGATTRAIADEAGVNEVTLFRIFETKERLLDAVVQAQFSASGDLPVAPPRSARGSLRADLLEQARRYEERVQENLLLIRTMIGEIHRHGDNERRVYQSLFRPLRDAMVDRFSEAQNRRELRKGVSPALLADLLVGMIFTGVLRRSSPHFHRDYSAAEYLETAVDLVLRGATA